MARNTSARAGWAQILLIVGGLALFVSGAVVLATEPEWLASPVGAGAALIAGGVTLVITTVARRRRERRDEVVADERLTTINEKSGNRAFQAAFAVQGLLFAAVSVTALELPVTTVLGGLFVFTALAYLLAYNHYLRVM